MAHSSSFFTISYHFYLSGVKIGDFRAMQELPVHFCGAFRAVVALPLRPLLPRLPSRPIGHPQALHRLVVVLVVPGDVFVELFRRLPVATDVFSRDADLGHELLAVSASESPGPEFPIKGHL